MNRSKVIALFGRYIQRRYPVDGACTSKRTKSQLNRRHQGHVCGPCSAIQLSGERHMVHLMRRQLASTYVPKSGSNLRRKPHRAMALSDVDCGIVFDLSGAIERCGSRCAWRG